MLSSSVKGKLTTEHLRSLFKNNFALVNYAIRLARFYVKTGREVSAVAILAEITKHPNESYLEMLETLEKEDDTKSYETT